MLYMWLLETWGWMEPLSQIRTKQIMWQWSQNRVALQKGVLSSSNSLWRDSARKSNSHDELKRRNCQGRLIDWPYIIFFAVGLADRLCLDIACSLVFRYMTWLRVMNTNVTRHEAINCIALIYKSCTVSKNLLLHKGIQYPPPPRACVQVYWHHRQWRNQTFLMGRGVQIQLYSENNVDTVLRLIPSRHDLMNLCAMILRSRQDEESLDQSFQKLKSMEWLNNQACLATLDLLDRFEYRLISCRAIVTIPKPRIKLSATEKSEFLVSVNKKGLRFVFAF